ncbi:MAG: hypothetical protein ABI045_06830 [Flavobacteriales bacterium]
MVVVDENYTPMSYKVISILEDNETLRIVTVLRDRCLITNTVIRTRS